MINGATVNLDRTKSIIAMKLRVIPPLLNRLSNGAAENVRPHTVVPPVHRMTSIDKSTNYSRQLREVHPLERPFANGQPRSILGREPGTTPDSFGQPRTAGEVEVAKWPGRQCKPGLGIEDAHHREQKTAIQTSRRDMAIAPAGAKNLVKAQRTHCCTFI
jgi:hypothetical protein